MSAFPEMSANPEVRSTVDLNFDDLKDMLYRRQRLDSLFWRSLLAQTGAVEYVEEKLGLPVTGDRNELFDNYHYEHLLITDTKIDVRGESNLTKAVRDGHLETVKAWLTPPFLYQETQNLAFEAAAGGHFDVVWFMLDNDTNGRWYNLIFHFLAGAAFYGQDEDNINKILKLGKDKNLETDFNTLYSYGSAGAICGGQEKWVTHFATLMGDEIEKEGHVSYGYSSVFHHFRPTLDSVRLYFRHPGAAVFRKYINLDNEVKTAILSKGSYQVIKWVADNGYFYIDNSSSFRSLNHAKVYESRKGDALIKESRAAMGFATEAVEHHDKRALTYLLEKGFRAWYHAMYTAIRIIDLDMIKYLETQFTFTEDDYINFMELARSYAQRGYPQIYDYFLSQGHPAVPDIDTDEEESESEDDDY